MKILKKGAAHICKKYECECNFCESTIRFLEGDPMYRLDWNGKYGMNEIKFVCPVCGQRNHLAETDYEGYGVPGGLDIENYYHLTKEDKEEVKTWKDIMTYLSDLSDEDLGFIEQYVVIKARHYDKEDEYIEDEYI